MRNLPNILSISRILLSLSILFVFHSSVIFIFLYTACGLTDIADGFVARKCKLETNLGAKLDSAGDFVFCMVILYGFITKTSIFANQYILITVVFTVFIRFANLILTRMKFQQWGMMHTVGNKTAGLLLYVSTPFLIYWGKSLFMLFIIVGVIAIISALEETAILIISKNYNPNKKSIFSVNLSEK